MVRREPLRDTDIHFTWLSESDDIQRSCICVVTDKLPLRAITRHPVSTGSLYEDTRRVTNFWKMNLRLEFFVVFQYVLTDLIVEGNFRVRKTGTTPQRERTAPDQPPDSRYRGKTGQRENEPDGRDLTQLKLWGRVRRSIQQRLQKDTNDDTTRTSVTGGGVRVPDRNETPTWDPSLLRRVTNHKEEDETFLDGK